MAKPQGQLLETPTDPTPQLFLFAVNSFTPSHQRFPSVAADHTGGFLVAWESRDQDDSLSVFARSFDAAGTAIDPAEFRVNAYTTSDQNAPRMASDSDGRFVVAWSSYLQDGSGSSVVAQRYGDLIFKDAFEVGG